MNTTNFNHIRHWVDLKLENTGSKKKMFLCICVNLIEFIISGIKLLILLNLTELYNVTYNYFCNDIFKNNTIILKLLFFTRQ